MKKLFTLLLLLLLLLTCSYTISSAQDMFGIANSNYAGLNGIDLNPSSIVDSRLGFDLNLITVGITADNNYLYIPKSNLSFFGFKKIADDAQNKGTGYTDAKNYPGDVNKNFNLSLLVRGPSVMFHVGKNWFGITLDARAAVDISNLNYSAAKFGYETAGLKYAPLQNQLLNSGAFSVGTMVWSEIGVTYGREIINNEKNYLKGAITVKKLTGYAAAYARTDGFDYKVDSNTINFYGANAQYGHSFNDSPKGQSLGGLSNGSGWGFDIGFTYEYRPNFQTGQYEMDGKRLDNPEENKYKWKVGVSMLDIGHINFNKNAEAFNTGGNNGTWVGWDTVKFKNITDYDTTLSSVFYNSQLASNNGKHQFDMALPHALSLQFDYQVTRYVYANATMIQKITTGGPGVVAANNLAITPRFEKNWMDVAVPISYYSYSQFRIGLALRLGSFIIGSDKFGSILGLSDLGGMDFYTSLKFSIGRHKIKDRDGDGVSDKMDKCPDQRGTWATLGCPDRDDDGIADKDDSCPDVFGLAKFHGCPDTDGDGIPDREDSCPTVFGLPQFHGCPDTDGDGIPDPQDSCPTVFGLPQFHGCPDTDGDGIPDPQDSCPLVKGPAWNHGCPVVEKVEAKKQEPVKATLTQEEEEVIAKVFKNLEFETGKSIIRESSYSSLNELAELLKKKPAFKILVDGHTDSVGGAASNLKLSNNRANAVKLYLTDKGIDASRITAKGYGLTKPIASNKTAEGRQKNRRVEFTIVQ